MTEPETRFLWYLCRTWRVFPDDPRIEELDKTPVMKAWMFYNWLEDYTDEYKLLENQGILIGSFTNPEAAKKMIGVGVDQHSSTDEEFEETSRLILEQNNRIEETKPIRKRKRRVIHG